MYKFAAILIIFLVTVVPLAGIIWAGLYLHWIAFGYVILHILFVNFFFKGIRNLNFDEDGADGGNEPMGARERVRAVMNDGRKTRSF